MFSLFKETKEMERNILESCKGIDSVAAVVGVKPKTKGVFTTNQSGSESSDEKMAVHFNTTDGNKVWSNSAFKFPCLLDEIGGEIKPGD